MTKNARIISYLLGAIMLLHFVSCNTDKGTLVPNNLTISEGFINPIGFYDNSPSFSWKLSAEVQAQGAYSVTVATAKNKWNDWRIAHVVEGPFLNDMLGDVYRWKSDGILSVIVQDTPNGNREPSTLKVVDLSFQSG